MRRTHWWAPDGCQGDQPHPPLLVLSRIGLRNPDTVIAQPTGLTRRHRQGTAHDGFHPYDGKFPTVTTGTKQLKEHGPAGAIFQCLGRPRHQTPWRRSAIPAAKRPTPADRPSRAWSGS
ncbi:hypothetical protein [Streptomyces sp. NPDC057238]|uniref:hypothetical protein n=1 Tax=Streptomyces sp. NPDC057238 TaxID=3346060 RepID=UPI0036417A95